MEDVLECDVLVIGAGLAGGIAALKAADLGARVILLSNGIESSSSWAQGGIVFRGAGDPDSLKKDILQAGTGRNFQGAVDLVVNDAERAVQSWLIDRLKVPFDRAKSGVLDLALEAAHGSPRILHVKDATGASISSKLALALADHSMIQQMEGSLVDLLQTDRQDRRREKQFASSKVVGALYYSSLTQKVSHIISNSVILASGGFSQLFLHSTGPMGSRGDGIAAAHRAGARTLDLEYVQFHPTSLFVRGKPRRLLTEALRGAGAKILSPKKTEFVDSLAPRDVVSRAIHEELLASGGEHVWLDLRNLQDIEEKFPMICKLLKAEDIDWRNDLVPIVPAAHYTIGGVWTDLDGATSLPGLYAAGEVACTGLHGANRLASTSLLEALVFGERAGVNAVRQGSLTGPLDFEPRPWIAEKAPVDPALLAQDWQTLRQTMWNYVGLVRSERRLRRAERLLVELRTEVESFYKNSQLSVDLISLRNAVLVSTLVLYSALRNHESVGTHYLKSKY
jgi:L-aspartate oxidase